MDAFAALGLKSRVCDNVRYIFLLLDDICGAAGCCQRQKWAAGRRYGDFAPSPADNRLAAA
jgi:hypothetical protein